MEARVLLKTLVLGLLANTLALDDLWARGDIGKVEKIAGEVRKIDGRKSGESSKVSEGELFFEGDSFETGQNSKLKIRLHEAKNSLVIGANTFITVEKAPSLNEIQKRKKGSQFFLSRGEVRSFVTPLYYNIEKGEAFEIRTRNSIAGVRGTSFYLAFDPTDLVTTLATLTGEVHFKGKKRSGLPITAGFLSRVVGDGNPSTPVPINMEDEEVKRKISVSGDMADDEAIAAEESLVR